MSPIKINHFTFRTCLIYASLFLVGIVFVAYVLFQARFLIEGPQITFTSVREELQTQRVVVIEGYANNIVGITLNGRSIYTDESGYFKETIVLENGYTVATLRAQDRYGRKTQSQQTFVYKKTALESNS